MLGYLSLDITKLTVFLQLASLSENCLLLGTDNICRQISEHIFMPNEGYCLYIVQVCRSKLATSYVVELGDIIRLVSEFKVNLRSSKV